MKRIQSRLHRLGTYDGTYGTYHVLMIKDIYWIMVLTVLHIFIKIFVVVILMVVV